MQDITSVSSVNSSVSSVCNYEVTICRLGEGCSHVAAILFKVESAVRHGYTSSTSNLCRWNQVFKDKVQSLWSLTTWRILCFNSMKYFYLFQHEPARIIEIDWALRQTYYYEILLHTSLAPTSSSDWCCQMSYGGSKSVVVVEPAAKRVCSAVTSMFRRIAVEGNIGRPRLHASWFVVSKRIS